MKNYPNELKRFHWLTGIRQPAASVQAVYQRLLYKFNQTHWAPYLMENRTAYRLTDWTQEQIEALLPGRGVGNKGSREVGQ